MCYGLNGQYYNQTGCFDNIAMARNITSGIYYYDARVTSCSACSKPIHYTA